MTNFRDVPSMQRAFSLAQQQGLLNPNRFPSVEAPLPDEMYVGALEEREAQLDVNDMLMGLGGTAVAPAADVPRYTNGFGGRGKSRHCTVDAMAQPAKEATDTVSERMKFIESLEADVLAEIEFDERTFYEYVEVESPYDGERFMKQKRVYDRMKIAATKALEKEALPYVLQALRTEAICALPRMRNYPSAARIEEFGEDQFVNVATLLGRLRTVNGVNEHTGRAYPWQDLVFAMIVDLKKRYDFRQSQQTYEDRRRNLWHPIWQDYGSIRHGNTPHFRSLR